MAGPAAQQYTPEETFAIINQIAQDKGDTFVIKVMRKRVNGYGAGLLDHAATLVEAKVNQIASAETWLPRLVGGGEFALKVSHAEAIHQVIGSALPVPLRDLPAWPVPDISCVNSPDWSGPQLLTYPKAQDVQAILQGKQTQNPATTVVQSAAANGVPNLPFGQPAQPPIVPPAPPVAGVPAGYVSQAYADEYARREKELAMREARMQAEFQAREDALKREQMEQRLRTENENRTRVLEGQLGELKALLVQQAQAKPVADGFSIEKAIAAATPLITAVLQGQQTARAELVAAQKAVADQNAEFMKQMMNKPAISPDVLSILEVNKAQSAAQADMMNHVFNAMQGVSKMSVQMIETVADLRLGDAPEGNPTMDIVREVVKGFSEMQKGVGVGGRKVVNGQAQQLVGGSRVPGPQQPQRPQVQVAPQPQRPQNYQQAAHGQPAPPLRQVPPVHNGATPQAVVQHFPEPVPNHPPAFDGAQPPAATAPVSVEIDTDKPASIPANVNALDVAEQLIRERTQPIEAVAKFIVSIFNRPEVLAELNSHNGEIELLFGARLGDWLMAESVHRDYAEQLNELVNKFGDEAGIFEPLDEDEIEGDEPPEENGAAES